RVIVSREPGGMPQAPRKEQEREKVQANVLHESHSQVLLRRRAAEFSDRRAGRPGGRHDRRAGPGSDGFGSVATTADRTTASGRPQTFFSDRSGSKSSPPTTAAPLGNRWTAPARHATLLPMRVADRVKLLHGPYTPPRPAACWGGSRRRTWPRERTGN